MALAAPPAAPSNWGRWPQQLPHDFPMMDHQGFISYDSRPPPPAHLQRPVPSQYVVAPAYSSGPITTMPAPHYQQPQQQQQQQQFDYVPYHSPPPSTPIGSPYKQETSRPTGSDVDGPRGVSCRRDSRQYVGRLPSPSERSDSLASTGTRSSNRSSLSIPSTVKVITYNEAINPADRINFETDVDELMKAIQHGDEQDEDPKSRSLTPAYTPSVAETMSGPQSPVSIGQAMIQGMMPEPKPKKKWICDGPNCTKRFVQKTHLDIHRRTHTGQKPYVCTKENCGLTFSQRGNLKTHMRRHTGEKPFSCRVCGKLFAQRGNVRSHEETHKGLKPFVCRLDNCNKTFSQLGNMKTHQNNFHKETIQRLTSMFVKFAQMGEVPAEHQELFDYFKEHYKNSNKGIKGRGKARTVAPKTAKGEKASPSSVSFTSVPVTGAPAPYVSASANSMPSMPRHHPANGYAMFDHQADQPPAGMLYEDEHARPMAFTDRLY